MDLRHRVEGRLAWRCPPSMIIARRPRSPRKVSTTTHFKVQKSSREFVPSILRGNDIKRLTNCELIHIMNGRIIQCYNL